MKKAKWMTNFVVDEVTGCWLWKGEVDDEGYGQIYFEYRGEDGRRRHKRRRAHRVFWEMKNGVIPEGFDVHHRCEVEGCVNEEHLVLIEHYEHAMLHRRPGKLTEEVVLRMRQEWGDGVSFAELGRRYGVCADHAADVARGVYWRHVGKTQRPAVG